MSLPDGWVLIDGYFRDSADASYLLGDIDNDPSSSDLDSDQDGVISFQDLLDTFDKNDNSLLEENEYAIENNYFFNSNNVIIVNNSDEDAYREPAPIFVMLDANEDGGISLEEALDLIDTDNDAIIEAEEYENFINSLP